MESFTQLTCLFEFKSKYRGGINRNIMHKKRNQKPHLFKKFKFPKNRTEITNKPK